MFEPCEDIAMNSLANELPAKLPAVPPALLGLLKTFARWADGLFPTSERLRQEYLAGAVDRSDLEHRIRSLERQTTRSLGSL